MKILRKFIPRFSFHYVAYTLMFFAVVFSVVHLVSATTPNPGHPWIEVGDGNIIFADPGAGPYTYTLPSANTTILTTNSLVTIAQGGTNASSFSNNGVVYYNNGSSKLDSVVNSTGSTLCLTQVSSGTPTWGACGSSYTFSTGLTNSSGTITANLSTGISGGQSAIGGTGASENLTLSSTTNGTKGKIIFGSLSAYDEVNDRFGIGQTTPSARLGITTNSLGTTQTATSGISLENSTAAANGAQQISPAMIWTGQGWKTDATAGSQSVAFRSYVLPAQGTANPSGSWLLQSSVDGGAYATRLSVGSSLSNDLIKIGDVAGGANLVSISSTGVALTGSGGVDLSAPVINFYSNGSDGMLSFNSSAGNYIFGDISVNANGSVFNLDDASGVAYYNNTASNGLFGINTTTPAAALDVVGSGQFTTPSATALTVARLGSNYAFQVDTNTASSATGLKVTAAAAGGGLALTTISSGTDENLTIDAKGAGTVSIGGTSTGNILLGGGSGSTGCTVTNSNGNFACTGTGTFSNLSGTNTGDVTLGSFGSSPNGNGASLSGQVLTLQPADGSNPGGVSTTTQTFAGLKTFNNGVTIAANQNLTLTSGSGQYTQTYTGTTTNAFSLSSSSLSSGALINLAITGTAGLNNQKGINVSLSGANASGGQTTYGGYFTNTHTGTSANVGIYANANGGSNNYGVWANTDSGYGVYSSATNGTAIYGLVDSSSGTAGYFSTIRDLETTNNTKTLRVENGGDFDTTSGVLTSYGGHFSNTSVRSSGSNALTNVALYVTASGAQNNYAAIFNAGYVGIGTTTPVSALDVVGQSVVRTDSSNYSTFSNNQWNITSGGGSTFALYDDGWINLETTGSEVLNFISPAGVYFQNDGTMIGGADLRFEETAGTNDYVAFQAPASIASSVTWTLPSADSTGTECLKSNGSGTLSFGSCGGASGLTVGTTTITSGSSGNILYNNAGVLGEMTTSGSGTVVALATGATLTSPTITTKISPTTDDGAPLGDTTHNFSDLFLASGAVINFANSNYTLTHSSGLLTASGALTSSGLITASSGLTSNGTLTVGANQNFTIASGTGTSTQTFTGTTTTANTITANSLTSGNIISLTSNGTGASTGQKGINVSLSGAVTGAQTTYGGYFSNTHTGASAVNYGIYAEAQNGATNYAAWLAGSTKIDAGVDTYADFNIGTSTFTISAGDITIGDPTVIQNGTTLHIDSTNSQFVFSNGSLSVASLGGSGTRCLQTDNLGVVSVAGAACGSGGITIGTTAVTSGTAGRVLFEGAGNVVSEDADFTFSTDTLTVTKIAATTFTGNLTTSAVNIVTDTTTGTKIGTATNQKLSFYNSTPVVQPTGDVATALTNLGLVASPTIIANTITARNLWGQSYNGSADITGSLTSVGDITGGASSMVITAGTGNSRTLTLRSTTAGGVATAFLTGNDDQSATFANVVTAGNFTVNATTVPVEGMYRPTGAGNLGFSVSSAAELLLTSTAFSPAADGGNSLGTTALGWQNIFGNTGFVLNIENGDWVATHTTGILTVGTGDFRITTAGTNSASVVTVGGTQTLTNKTLTSPNINEAVALTSTSTKLNYLTSAGGTTGTTSTNIVFSGSPTIATPTITTSATVPLLIGSTSANGTLTFEGNNTTGNTATNANLIFNVGDSAGTTAMTILNNGKVGIGDSTPADLFTVGSGDLFQIDSSGNTSLFGGADMRFVETGGGTDYVAFQAPTSVTSSVTWTLPNTDSTGTQCLKSNGSGVLSFGACGAGGGLTIGDAIASGTANRVLYEGASNTLSESANFTYDGTTLAVATSSTTASNKALNISQTGGTSGTDYAGYFSNTGGATTNVGLYATATGATNNYAGVFESGRVLIGTASDTTSIANLYMSRALVNEDGSTGAGVAGIHEVFTMNPSSGTPTQVGNRLTIENTTGSVASTQIGQIIRMTDSTSSLSNTIRGLEVVASVGSNTSGTNTGIRATGKTFGVQGITIGTAGGVSAPAALYGEMQGTTQGDALRLFSNTVTSSPAMATFYQDTSVFSGAGILMDFGSATSDTYTGKFLDLKNDDDTKFYVDANGKVSLTLDGTSSTAAICGSQGTGTSGDQADIVLRDCSGAPAADYAEMYPVENGVEYGDIVTTGTEVINTYDTTNGNIDWNKVKGKITKLVKSSSQYQKNVVGIVVDNHGDFTSSGYNVKQTDNPMPVALNGRVPVKVANDSSDIMPGDYITTSDTEPGKAKKATKSGTVIGKALEVWTSQSGAKTIMVYVEQGFYNGQGVSQFAGIDPLSTDFSKLALKKFMQSTNNMYVDSEILTDRVSAGLEVITPRLVADNVSTNIIKSSTGENVGLVISGSGKFTIGGTVQKNSDGTSQVQNPAITFDSLGNATFNGKVTAKEIQVGDLSGIQSITDQINQLAEGQMAFNLTASAMNALTGALTVAQADISNIKNDVTGINQKVDGLTILGSDLDNRLKAIENIFTSNVFNNVVSLSTTALAVSGQAQFDGQSIFNGEVRFGSQTEFVVPPLFNKNSAGYALIKEGDRRARIEFENPYIATPVVNTSVTFETGDNIDDATAGQLFANDVRFIIVSKDQTGFTILLNKNAPRDIRFSWNALAVRDPKIFESVFEGLTIDNNTSNTNPTDENQGNNTTGDGGSTDESSTPSDSSTPVDNSNNTDNNPTDPNTPSTDGGNTPSDNPAGDSATQA